MPRETIAIGADHAGYAMKATLAVDLAKMGYDVLDLGTNSDVSVDYPDFAFAVAAAIKSGRATRGILVCGTGIGMAIAANRDPAIRAALCTGGLMARLAREHNDANVLAMGSRIIGIEAARECVRQFLSTSYASGRHADRVAKLTHIELEAAE
ncbi:MAG: ribose 5-phosphate isomerase B [Sphingomonadaceae bacterium]|nr:ribose 5-phosphate isomerase B [Sphingomonadaceae bacterium]